MTDEGKKNRLRVVPLGLPSEINREASQEKGKDKTKRGYAPVWLRRETECAAM
jgi:hypothetical protein